MAWVRLATRESISFAALLVNVSSRICSGGVPFSMSRATRYVKVRVLPLPAPAMTSTGPAGASTTSSCSGLSSAA